MFPQTVQQVKRWLKIASGFTLLAIGIVMLVTPGPGWVVIFAGLALLAAEYVWARRLLQRLKDSGTRLRNAVMPSSKASSATASNTTLESETLSAAPSDAPANIKS